MHGRRFWSMAEAAAVLTADGWEQSRDPLSWRKPVGGVSCDLAAWVELVPVMGGAAWVARYDGLGAV